LGRLLYSVCLIYMGTESFRVIVHDRNPSHVDVIESEAENVFVES
jgi:hypothetical protein